MPELTDTVTAGQDRAFPVLAVVLPQGQLKGLEGLPQAPRRKRFEYEEIPAYDRQAKRRKPLKYEKEFNSIVGEEVFYAHYSMDRMWTPDGRAVRVDRYYPGARVAFWLGASDDDGEREADMRTALEAQGIILVFIPLGATVDADDIIAQIARDRARLVPKEETGNAN